MKKTVLFVFLTFAFTGASLYAHDFFMRPERAAAYRNGDTVTLGLYTSHSFTEGGILGAADRNEVYVLQGTKITPLALAANEERKIFEMRYRLDGAAPAVAVAHRMPSFSCVTSEGIKRGTRSEIQAQGFTVLSVTVSESWSKVYINPASGDTTFSNPLGIRLEIVPVTNPAALRRNRAATFRALYNGRPLAGCDVAFANEREDGFNSTVKTDGSGNALITPNAEGLLFIRAGFSAPVSGNAEYDRESLTSIAVFNVSR